ncbi:MAG: TIGR03936 family radical SAM-associated protein [Oscillospiraceae bacterium]|nr:TIGR03936 family radical SAM-associated protein [Oscillospiraceae bacterium]
MNKFINIRVFFEKRGNAKYISHLDLYRAFQRAIKRSGLPVWHTEGFNPHIYTTFALPLALGVEGVNESVDLRLLEEVSLTIVKEKLNAVIPHGLNILRVAEPVKKANDIKKANYRLDFRNDGELKRLGSYLSQPEIIIIKKSKTKVKTLDIKPLLEWDDSTKTLCLPAGNELNISPWNVLSDFEVAITRTSILCENNSLFE